MPTQSLICPVLIGRETHLEMMEQVLVQARTGQGQTILVAGEAGRGKSRLSAEFKTRAIAQGWRCVQGNCYETERNLPYAPIAEILQDLDQIPAYLTPLLSRTSNPASFDKHQLYFELAAFLSRLAASQPLFIVVEDLHWCDDASLELLLYLARRLTDSQILFLVTFRDNGIQLSLAHYLSQLDRERRARELRLAPLSRADTSLMIQTIFGQNRPTRAEFIDKLYPLTEGNPFYIEETLKSMLMAGDIVVSDDGIWAEGSLGDLHIPRSVQDSVQQRSQQLSPEARNVLTLAAVAGRHFDFDLLQKLTGHDEATLLELFKELLAAQLINEISADQFAFRHALTRETVYLSILARERRQLHACIAETLEELSAGSDIYLGDLAYHFYIGENWDKTLLYAHQAGERAQALNAYTAAIDHFSHALEASSHVAPTEFGQLCYQRGYAHMLADHFDAAQDDLLNSLNESCKRADQSLEWEAIQALGHLWVDRDYSRAGEYYQQAQSLARELDDPKRVAASLNTVGNWQMNQGHPFAGLRNHHEALAISQSLDDPLGVAQALDYLGIASLHCGQIPQGRAYYDQVLPIWDSLAFPRGTFNAYSSLAFAADYDLEMDEQPVEAAIQWGEKSIELSHHYGWRSAESLALISTGLALRQQGDAAHALTVLQQGLEIAEEIEHIKFMAAAHGALGEVYLDVLAFATARHHLEAALELARQTHSAVRIQRAIAYLTEAHIYQNEFDRAQALLDEVLDEDGPMQGILSRMLWGVRIELALAKNEGNEALTRLDQMVAATENLTPVFAGTDRETLDSNSQVIPRLWYLRGQALIALTRFPEAEQDLQAALGAANRQDRRWQLWRIYRELARVQIMQRRLDAAKVTLDFARQEIEAIAAGLRESWPNLAEQFIQKALASLPDIPEPSTEQRLKQKFGGLTAREREIAARVAQGKTNREIADEFVLSERTAERHVANIMKKLGFSTRTQIAAWVVEKGLDYTQV